MFQYARMQTRSVNFSSGQSNTVFMQRTNFYDKFMLSSMENWSLTDTKMLIWELQVHFMKLILIAQSLFDY